MSGLASLASSFFGTSQIRAAPAAPKRAVAPCVVPIRAAIVGPGKKWESFGDQRPRVSMPIRLQDTVKVIAGSDKGTLGKVVAVDTKRGMVVVEGVNIKTRHVKPQQGEEGQIVKKEFPVHHSNVALYSTAQQVTSRVGYKVVDGKKVRYLKKTGEVLPAAERPEKNDSASES